MTAQRGTAIAAPALPRTEWVGDLARLDAIEPAWRALEDRVPQRTHVSTFDFIATWYRHYAGDYGGDPLIGLAWHGRDLVGVAPLTIRRGRVGRIPVTRIDFAPTDSIAGEFLVPEAEPGIVDALVEALVTSRVKFDVICLNGFDPASPLLPVLHRAAERHRLSLQLERHASAIVDLRAGYDAYYAGLSGHYRRNLRQKARKIAAARYRVDGLESIGDADTAQAAFERMIAINEASYKLQGAPLADHHRRFLADIVRRFAARRMLRLPILSIGGRDAAYMLGVVERGAFYDITLAYDEQFAKLSPGAFLTQHVLEGLAAEGVHTVVSHGAHEYKRHWSTAFVPQERVFLFAPGLKGMATRVVRFGLQPLWKRLTAQETE